MIEKLLLSHLAGIFELDVTFDRVSESREQERAFVEIREAKVRLKEGRQTASIVGRLRVFAQAEKLPLGFLAKKIEAASLELTRGFYFYDLEENAGTYRNIVERSASFVFLFDSQYDPALGTLNVVNLSHAENPS